jgi:hypothetical protein
LTPRVGLRSGLVAFALLGAAGMYAHSNIPLSCDSEEALRRVTEILRDEYHLDSIFVNNVRTVSGGVFSGSHDCSAEVVEIRGNVNASDMPWRGIRYRIVRQDQPPRPAITVELGGYVPLAEPTPSLWTRLLVRLGATK